MLTILASIVGLLGSTLPNIFKIFQAKADQAQEIAIMGIQLEMAKLNMAGQLQAVGVQADVAEQKILYSTYETGVRWVDALNGCVRPIIAFSFFFLFFLTKLPYLMLTFRISWGEKAFATQEAFLKAYNDALFSLWTDNDAAIFAGIIAFYFGSRAMMKMNIK